MNPRIQFPYHFEPPQTNFQLDLAVISFFCFQRPVLGLNKLTCSVHTLPSHLLLSPPFPSSYFPSLFPLSDFSRTECCCIRSNSWSPAKVHSKASQLVRFFPLPFPSLLPNNLFLLKLCMFSFLVARFHISEDVYKEKKDYLEARCFFSGSLSCYKPICFSVV